MKAAILHTKMNVSINDMWLTSFFLYMKSSADTWLPISRRFRVQKEAGEPHAIDAHIRLRMQYCPF